METIRTLYGSIEAIRVERFPGGQIKSLVPGARTLLTTPYGTFTPQYEGCEERRRMIPEVSFYPNGTLRALPLQEQALVTTPLGSLPAEMITLYDNGAVKRVFPMNGKLSGFWTQEDEEKLAEELSIHTPFGPVSAKFISICFDSNGSLRSLTLWPGQILTVPTPLGVLPTRVGVSLYASGQVASMEPARPLRVPTRIGVLHAYDPDAHGVHGDHNSLSFDLQGEVLGLTTVTDQVAITGPDGLNSIMKPAVRESMCSEDVLEPVPMQIHFEGRKVVFQTGPKHASCFPLDGTRFCISGMNSGDSRLRMPSSSFTLQQGCTLC